MGHLKTVLCDRTKLTRGGVHAGVRDNQFTTHLEPTEYCIY